MKRLVGVLAALVLVVGASTAYVYAFGIGHGDRAPYAAYPSAQQVASFSFMTKQYDARVRRGENPQLVFGSSELNPGPAGPAHPANLLAGGRYDISTMVVGRAGCTDLWQAIEIGAFASHLKGPKRIVLFPSIQWFMSYRRPDQDFPPVFSQGAYEAFMHNDRISEGLKRRVTARMASYGVDRTGGSLPLAQVANEVDDTLRSFVSDLRLANDYAAAANEDDPLAELHADDIAGDRADAGSGPTPDWNSLFTSAARTARKQAQGNEFGFNDTWYRKKYRKWVDGANRNWKVEDGAYFSQQEFEDFEMALEACREAGVEPLVVLQPVKGEAYDQTVYTKEVRARYYDMMRAACKKAGVQVADFSSHEYDTYFLRDYSHPSDLGSAYYSKAIYTFFETGRADTSPSGDVAAADAASVEGAA